MARFDAAGDIVWMRQFGTEDTDYLVGVAANADGIYAVGRTAETLPGQTSSGNDDALVARFDASGNLLWARQFGSHQV